MASEFQAAHLRDVWNREALGQYEGQWIAFDGQVVANGRSLIHVMTDTSQHDEEGNGPIYAFVTFASRG